MIPFFSIIIPVYNGLLHNLPVCLDSIWSQPIESSLYEVICVDDCSTDETRAWLKQQQKLHPNLKVIEHTVNQRQGGARNSGMKAAKGEYLVFIDQDDYYHPNVFEKIYTHLQKTDLDVFIVDCTYEYPGQVGHKLQHNFSHLEVLTGDEQIVKNSLPSAPWKLIIRRNLILEHNCFFDAKERIEDVDWTHKVVHYAQKTQYQPILFIHYIKNELSTTMTAYFSPETIFSAISCGIRLHQLKSTVFKESKDDVKNHIGGVSASVINYGLRCFLFCRCSVKSKAQRIQLAKKSIPFKEQTKLTRLAFSFPYSFAIISNLSSFFFPAIIWIYRKIKYSRKLA
jgi:glycosyltransferase involved in cell wall biosynthesis